MGAGHSGDARWDGVQQRRGVFVSRIAENLGYGPMFDNAASLHHGNAVRKLSDEGEVMRNKDIGQSELACSDSRTSTISA
nr:hypothetical protein RP007_01934 [Rhizobium sp. P007]